MVEENQKPPSPTLIAWIAITVNRMFSPPRDASILLAIKHNKLSQDQPHKPAAHIAFLFSRYIPLLACRAWKQVEIVSIVVSAILSFYASYQLMGYIQYSNWGGKKEINMR